MAAGRRTSSDAISTRFFSLVWSISPSLADVVVLPEPCRPTIRIGAGALPRSRCGLFVAERFDQLVVHDLDDLLARRDGADDVFADGLGAHGLDEVFDDGQRHVGIDQGAADLAQALIDIGFGERAAPAELVEDPAEAGLQTVEHASTFGPPIVPKHENPRGRTCAAWGRSPPEARTGSL